MMSTENLLGEAKDVEQPSPRSLKKSIKAELERHALENLGFGLSISVLRGAILFLLAGTGTLSPLHWIWFAGLCTSSLVVWLWKVRAARSGGLTTSQSTAIVVTASSLFALLWGLASPLFLNPEQPEIAVISVAVIATLSTAWPLNYAHSTLCRHLFLAAILGPLLASIYLYYPQMQVSFLALVILFYAVANRAVVNYRKRLEEASADKIKSRDRSEQIITTSQKIASLIEQTPLGFIEWNQQREIISWNTAATTIFGYSKEEVLGRTTDFLFDQKKTFLQQQVENDLFLFGKDFTGTAENITSDGTVIICEWNDTPLFDDAREPFVIKDEKFRISCSIGIVLFNDGSSDGDAILQRADKALYTIKREGKSNFYFHNQKPPSELQAQALLIEQLQNKASNESFIPFYQPILDTESNLISGLQVFLRWKNPDNELIPASEIIQVLESSSMIVDISLSLLEQIFRQVELWRNQDLWREEQKIYFTLSLRELEHGGFIDNLQRLISQYHINPQTLTFGLHTETLPKIHKPLGMKLGELKKLGISFIVDNVGYQNLPIQKLRDFEIDTIRISHKLMSECSYMESSWNLIKGLVDLAKSEDLNCIAPGVEEPEIHHLLISTGCQFLQGNLIAPPSPATSITRMLIERNVSQKEESVV